MRYALKVSYDCGISYCPVMVSDNLDEIEEEAKVYDRQNLRWTIEDEDGNLQSICTIHAHILATLIKLSNQKES